MGRQRDESLTESFDFREDVKDALARSPPAATASWPKSGGFGVSTSKSLNLHHIPRRCLPRVFQVKQLKQLKTEVGTT